MTKVSDSWKWEAAMDMDCAQSAGNNKKAGRQPCHSIAVTSNLFQIKELKKKERKLHRNNSVFKGCEILWVFCSDSFHPCSAKAEPCHNLANALFRYLHETQSLIVTREMKEKALRRWCFKGWVQRMFVVCVTSDGIKQIRRNLNVFDGSLNLPLHSRISLWSDLWSVHFWLLPSWYVPVPISASPSLQPDQSLSTLLLSGITSDSRLHPFLPTFIPFLTSFVHRLLL